MFEADFLEMMPFVVGLVLQVGETRENDPIYETDPDTDEEIVRRYRCRISGKSLALRQPLEGENTPIFDIHLGARIEDDGTLRPIGDDPLNEGMKVILPEEQAWDIGTPIVFAVGRYPDEHGQHHAKIQLGWRYHRQGQ